MRHAGRGEQTGRGVGVGEVRQLGSGEQTGSGVGVGEIRQVGSGEQTGSSVGVGVDSGTNGEALGVGRHTVSTHVPRNATEPVGELAALVLADAIRAIPNPETAKRIIPASVPTSQRDQPGLPRRLM